MGETFGRHVTSTGSWSSIVLADKKLFIVNQAGETFILNATPEFDPDRLEQVVVNLLNNAAKYTDTGGLIRLSVTQTGTEAVIRIRDNGVGIAPDMLPHIFELFTQVDGSLGRSYGGLGIGLALATKLVEMHDGRLQASSAGVGKG